MAGPSVRHLNSDGFTTIPVMNWPDAFAGVTQRAKKFGAENNGDRVLGSSPGPASSLQWEIDQIGTNDGSGMLRIGADTATLSPPYGLTAVLGPAGGAYSATGTYGWKVSALNAVGETIGSFEATFNVTDTTKKVTLAWTTIPGATNYRIYRTSTPGTYVSPTLIALVGAVGTYDDTGSAASAGVPPSFNNTGGWILSAALGGAGGVWGSTGSRFWTLVAYNADNTILTMSLEATFNVTDITKKVTLTWPTVVAADHYILYRSTGTGVYNTPAVRATIAGGVTTFSDDGSALSTGSIVYDPSYGIPPTLDVVPFVVGAGNLAIGQHSFYWVNRVVPLATPEDGNPRAALTTIKEI